MTMTRDFAGPGDRAGAPGPSVPGPGRRPSPRLLAICAGPATRLRGVVDGRPVDVLSGIVKRPASTLEDPVFLMVGEQIECAKTEEFIARAIAKGLDCSAVAVGNRPGGIADHDCIG